MKKNGLIILLIFVLMQALNAQDTSDVLIIEPEFDISIPDDKFVRVVKIEQNSLSKKTKEELDTETKVFRSSKSDTTEVYASPREKDSSNVWYEGYFSFQYGGEAKFAFFLPKLGIIRKHKFDLLNPYYGVELGLHALFVTGAYSMAVVCGTEISIFKFESTLSYFGIFKIAGSEDMAAIGPFNQASVNFKLGAKILGFIVKLGISFPIHEYIPVGQERAPILDVGKINGTIFGVEICFQ